MGQGVLYTMPFESMDFDACQRSYSLFIGDCLD